MAYRIVAIPSTLSAPIAGLLSCDFSYSCAAVDEIQLTLSVARSLCNDDRLVAPNLMSCNLLCYCRVTKKSCVFRRQNQVMASYSKIIQYSIRIRLLCYRISYFHLVVQRSELYAVDLFWLNYCLSC